METKRVIISKVITVTQAGQIIHFQIKLPADTVKVTGIKVSTMRKLKIGD